MKQILVVGSDPKMSQDLDRHLDPEEFKLLACPHGKSLIRHLTNVKPDLVILDLDSMEPSGQDIFKKIRTLNFDLPLIVLSKESTCREKERVKENYKVVPPPFQMEKIAAMVKEALPLRSPKQEQKILQGSVRLSSQKREGVMLENNPDRTPDNPDSSNQDYHHIFARTLEPIFDQIIQNCRGHVYDRLLSGLEKTMLSEVLKHVNHNQVQASQLLGISRNTLRERMKRYDIF